MKLFYVAQSGRSMIEMLGVLSIVGILSVGGISAFSKAMMTWKYQKLCDEYTEFLEGMLRYKQEFVRAKRRQSPSAHFHYASYVELLGILPSSWKVSYTSIRDSMGNSVHPFVRNDRGELYETISADIILKKDSSDMKMQSSSSEMCQLLVRKVFISFHEDAVRLWLYNYDDDGKGSNGAIWYGDLFCKGGRKCLKDMSVSDVVNFCDLCNGAKVCDFIIAF